MREEPVRAIAASWHREWRSCTDDDGLTAFEAPCLRSCPPSAFELLYHHRLVVDRGQGTHYLAGFEQPQEAKIWQNF